MSTKQGIINALNECINRYGLDVYTAFFNADKKTKNALFEGLSYNSNVSY